MCEHCNFESEDQSACVSHESVCIYNPSFKHCLSCAHRVPDKVNFGLMKCEYLSSDFPLGKLTCEKWEGKF